MIWQLQRKLLPQSAFGQIRTTTLVILSEYLIKYSLIETFPQAPQAITYAIEDFSNFQHDLHVLETLNVTNAVPLTFPDCWNCGAELPVMPPCFCRHCGYPN